jgi:glutathione-independent formaldehyde dehydrogenase
LTGICLNVNGDRAGGAYGYVDMGGDRRSSAMVPYADFQPIEIPDKEQAMERY